MPDAPFIPFIFTPQRFSLRRLSFLCGFYLKYGRMKPFSDTDFASEQKKTKIWLAF
jgi:hypothetical protein